MAKIPALKTRKQASKFWDTHDIGDFMDDLTIVKGVYKPKKNDEQEVLSLRVPTSLKRKLKRLASGYHISVSDLIRLWIMEKISKL